MTWRAGLALGLGLLWSVLAGAAGLAPAVNLQADARAARAGGYPVVVLFSRHDCRYCETVRRDHLLPLLRSQAYRGRVVVRQIDQDRETPLIDFTGAATTHAAFARRERVRLVPVVAFYGAQGQALADPIVGLRLPDFYDSYLESALQAARR